jgi:O-antigen/teichoic acid export membrane protein
MKSNTRTYKSFKNSVVALSIFAINFVLQFISRKVFLDQLGIDVLGLNTTATSLLQFLNLAELGVEASITFSLYKPLSENDYTTINEIVSVQGWLYRKIAMIVIAGSVILMAFFPLIFAKIELPLWYAYASFGVLLFSSLLSYFVNYKQIILTASQQGYKIQYSYRVVLLVKVVFQIIFLNIFANGYIWWLVLEFIFSIIASIALNIAIKKTCPYLHTAISAGRVLKKKYPIIITKIKQFFFHKIATYVLTQTSSIIIYAFTTLRIVAIYGNYMIIVNGITSLLNAIFNGMVASVGDLVSGHDKNKILGVFRELFTSRFLIVTTLAFAIYTLANPFITLWIGAEYKLGNTTLILIIVTFYLNTQRSVVDSFISAYGLFKDIWAPVAEAVLNIGISVFLGYFFGLNGILLGVIISSLIIVFLWKPYFLFSNALNHSVIWFLKLYLKHLLVFIFVFLIVIFCVLNSLNIKPEESVNSFLLYSIIGITSFSLFLFVGLYVLESGMRRFTDRLIKISK